MQDDFEKKFLIEITKIDDMKAEIVEFRKQLYSIKESILETQKEMAKFI